MPPNRQFHDAFFQMLWGNNANDRLAGRPPTPSRSPPKRPRISPSHSPPKRPRISPSLKSKKSYSKKGL